MMVRTKLANPRIANALEQLADAHSLPLSTWRAASIAFWQRELIRLSQEFPETTYAQAA